MRGEPAALSAGQLLDAWEAGCASPLWARPVALLGAVDVGGEDLAALPIGERDRRLGALRRSVFGTTMEATVACPACGEQAELSFSLDELLPAPSDAPLETVSHGGYQVQVRPPTTADLAALAGAGVAGLLARCLLSATDGDGEVVDPAALPEEVVDAVSAALADADPAADLLLALDCPACSHWWSAPLDLAAFVWQEVEAWAERTLMEVDALARAYGWPEPAVLALSPWRRQRYLELAGA